MLAPRELTQLLKRLKSADPDDRDQAAAELGDLVEANQLTPSQYQRAMRTLIPLAVAESDSDVKESMFHTLSAVTATTPVEAVDWKPIADSLDELTPDCLEYALYVLGSSGNQTFVPRLKAFLGNPNPVIRETASGALRELAEPGHTVKTRAN